MFFIVHSNSGLPERSEDWTHLHNNNDLYFRLVFLWHIACNGLRCLFSIQNWFHTPEYEKPLIHHTNSTSYRCIWPWMEVSAVVWHLICIYFNLCIIETRFFAIQFSFSFLSFSLSISIFQTIWPFVLLSCCRSN